MSPVLVGSDGAVEIHAHRSRRAAERVRQGAEMLDEARPGWASEVDLETLDMRDPLACVIGQLYACPTHEDYHRALYELAPPTVSDYAIDDWAAEHGLCMGPEVVDPELLANGYELLRGAWCDEIARRGADPGATRPPAPPRSQGPRGGGRG